MDQNTMKKILAKIAEQEHAVDEIHQAAADLALMSLSDEDLLGLYSGEESAGARFEEIRACYAACSSAAEARAIYLTFWPGTVNFTFQTETALSRIELGARMRK